MPDEPKIEVEKTPVQKLQEFLDKEGLVISANPTFVQTNHGSFEVAIRVSVEKR